MSTKKSRVPRRFFEGNLGSAEFFEVILGSATSKRLKNTDLDIKKSKVITITKLFKQFDQNKQIY
jgi:hypothetical protein